MSSLPSDSKVPQPPPRLIVGNLGELDSQAPIQSMMRLARTYGPIYKLNIVGRDLHVVSSQALVDELCDETRFNKRVHGPLAQIRAFAGDGLFTAYNREPNWAKAHRLLMPAFGPLGVRSMFDRMVDIADQMFVKWQRFGPSAVIDVADNMTRLTLDTIALCAFDYRFNSFYQNEMHPFVAAMVDALDEAGQRARRPNVVSTLMLSTRRKYDADRELLARVAEQLIAERRQDPHGREKNDLLNVMLNGVDTVTGERLSDENIRFQLVTFLIAGHETTSGLLSFATYLLLKNPEVTLEAQKIVDDVLGTELPRVEHLAQLRYLEQVLMESLRLWPTAPAFGVKPIEDTLLAGRYPLTTRDTVLILEPMLHRDPAVWGDDAESFRPERFAPENAQNLPPNAWKPFGNGARACIGRPFAMQEAQLVLAMMLQRFDIVFDDPSYQLEIAETLTIKPRGLAIRARARGNRVTVTRPERDVRGAQALHPGAHALVRSNVAESALPADAPRVLVLYGSNSGSCEMFARRVAADARRHQLDATVLPMDDCTAKLESAVPVIVVIASYEGQAPDNARKFVSWLDGCAASADAPLSGISYVVFGCGNRQWARTYQWVPKRVDAAFASAGATRMRERAEADAGGDFFGAFDQWLGELWPAVGAVLGREIAEARAMPGFKVEILPSGRPSALQLNEHEYGVIVENRELVDMTRPGARSKRHLQIALPEGMCYNSGDYLAVLARNPAAIVNRALVRFGLASDTEILIHKEPGAAPALPGPYPVTAHELLAGYVELAQPATRAQIAELARATRCPPERLELERLTDELAHRNEVLEPRVSVLDLLERTASCELDLADFLAMLPTLRARQYSISSSPLAEAKQASLTVAVVAAQATSGNGEFQGVASNYLARRRSGDRVSVAVRASQTGFHPPADPATPIVLVCAGTGVAPFRGFLQERAAQQAGGRSVGRALLFFGIDDPEVDFLYRDELLEWQRRGVVELRMAYSLKPEGDVSFVQHRVWQDRADIGAMFEAGAQFYLCGDGARMAPAVRATFMRIYQHATGADDEAAQRWADAVEHEHGRFVSDVFA